MKIGSMNDPRLDLISEIRRIGESGFDFIDLTYEWPSNENLSLELIKKEIGKYKLEVIGHTSPSLPAIYPLKSVQDSCLAELERAVDFFVELGAEKVNVHPFYFIGYEKKTELLNQNIKLLNPLNNYCKSKGILLMLENFKPPFDTTETFQTIINSVPGLKVHLDVGHFNISGNLSFLLNEFFQVFGQDIIHCHIHDNNGAKDQHLPLGCGNINFDEVIKICKVFGYNQSFTLEVFCHDRYFLDYSQAKWQKLWAQD